MKLQTLITEPWADYGLVDSGHGRKLEFLKHFDYVGTLMVTLGLL